MFKWERTIETVKRETVKKYSKLFWELELKKKDFYKLYGILLEDPKIKINKNKWDKWKTRSVPRLESFKIRKKRIWSKKYIV